MDCFVPWIIEFIGWLGDIIRSLFPWPFIVLILIWITARSESAKGTAFGILKQIRKVKFAGVAEVELSEETRRELTHRAEDLEQFVDRYRERINRETAHLVDLRNIQDLVQEVVEGHIIKKLPNQKLPVDFRCTIHVEDFVFRDRLYQLTDYYPSGNGSGRVKSVRYGVIGKAHRSQIPQIKGNLLDEILRAKLTEAETIKHIALHWGLTVAEARRVVKYPSYCAVPIKHGSKFAGVFYMDSTVEKAFSGTDDDEELAKTIQGAAETTGLAEEILEVIGELKSASAKLRI